FDSVYHVYRLVWLLLLMAWCWGGDLYVWTINRINYSFILRLDIRTHIRWQHLLESAGAVTMLWIVSLMLYLLASLAPEPVFHWMSKIPYQIYPLSLLVVIFALGLFQSVRSKFWLAKLLFEVVTAPFHRIKFVNFYLSEQLC